MYIPLLDYDVFLLIGDMMVQWGPGLRGPLTSASVNEAFFKVYD